MNQRKIFTTHTESTKWDNKLELQRWKFNHTRKKKWKLVYNLHERCSDAPTYRKLDINIMDLGFIDFCSVPINGIAYVYRVDHVLKQMYEETEHQKQQQPSQ